MSKRIVLLMMLISVFICTSVLPLRFEVVKASGTIYIMADGSVDPPTAPIQRTENTYTLTDNIYEPIVVKRNYIVVDGAGYTVQGTGSGKGIDLSGRDYVTIKNTEIRGFDISVYLYQLSSNNAVLGNNITNCSLALWLDYYANSNSISGNNIEGGIALGPVSCNNRIYGNHLSSSFISLDTDSNNNSISENSIAGGVFISYSRYNTIVENNITTSGSAVSLRSSSNNSVLRNTFANGGLWVDDSYGNLVESNTINGKPLVYLESVSNHTVDNAGQVILINCHDIVVQNLDLSNARVGIQMERTSYTEISNNNITNNSGIELWDSANNSISGNNIVNGGGIFLQSSANNSISGNNITSNGSGIQFQDSSYNIVSGNDITANTHYGVSLYDSENNSILHNNFMENQEHASIESGPFSGSYSNLWDDGVEGNFWSNYTGVDNDQDGIGDSPHVLDPENRDNHPLMGAFSSFSTSEGDSVTVVSNSTIENFQCFQSNSTINIHVSNATTSQTFGFCRVCIPHSLMNETYHVAVNDAEPKSVNYTVYDDGSNRWIYFNYGHSTLEIVIVPEFSSVAILLLSVTITTVVATFYKKEHYSFCKNL
jgi:parallel beta-helix repeat protein